MLTDELKQALGEFRSSILTDVKALIQEATADEEEPEDKDGDEEEEDESPEAIQESLRELRTLLESTRADNAVRDITARVTAAKLPAPVSEQIITQLTEALGRRAVEVAEVDAAISLARTVIKESGRAHPSWPLASLTAGDSAHDQMVKALQGWFKGEAIDGVRPVRDLRESYAGWVGQGYLDADPWEMFHSFASRYDSARNHAKLQESLATADWGQVFADVFYLQMIQSYKASPDYDKWRMVCSDIESVPDFRTRHWTRVGGYSDFTTVGEKETYPTITSPGDEEIQYAVQKYGGLDDISMEMILGDRLAIVRKLPQLMGYAASRTLYKFVFDLITTGNPTMDYDSTTLYHSDHGNTGSTALSLTSLDAIVVAMRSQTAFGQSQEILGTRNKPKHLIIPAELESRAQRILNPSDAWQASIASVDADTTMDPQRFKGSGIGYHVYDQLTNASKWWAVADPSMVPTMVVGFLNGRQEPELFTQDQPNVGSTFTADKISYKLRFVFGGDVLEHRSFYRQDV
jgi:hypothetical protein